MINNLFSDLKIEKVTPAIITLDSDSLPQAQDIYFQKDYPIAESLYHYLHNSELLPSLIQKADTLNNPQDEAVSILHRLLEIGFGTGLNFLITYKSLYLLNNLKQFFSGKQLLETLKQQLYQQSQCDFCHIVKNLQNKLTNVFCNTDLECLELANLLNSLEDKNLISFVLDNK